jgi:hypothetical protein
VILYPLLSISLDGTNKQGIFIMNGMALDSVLCGRVFA